MGRRVVIFDLGGVVLESPIVEIKKFCESRGLSDLNRLLGSTKSWARLERSEIAAADFPAAVHQECMTAGHSDGVALGVDGWSDLLLTMQRCTVRPQMVHAIQTLRSHGELEPHSRLDIELAQG